MSGSSPGFSLLETLLVLVVAGVSAGAGIAGARALADALSVEAARGLVIDALLEGRRLAYLREATVTVKVPVGASAIEILPDHRRVPLPAGVVIASSPSDAGVDFRATALADNATVSVAAKGGASATVVVNQRGQIR